MLLTSIVAGGQGAEPLLTGCVPDLQLDHIIFVLDRLQFEVDTDGIKEVFVESVLGVAQEQARLAHATVADDQHLK